MKAEEAAEMMESQKESDTFKQRAAVAIAFFAMVQWPVRRRADEHVGSPALLGNPPDHLDHIPRAGRRLRGADASANPAEPSRSCEYRSCVRRS